MIRLILFAILFLVNSCFTYAQNDWQFVEELNVGKRPAQIFNFNSDNSQAGMWVVYCAGLDQNHNGINDLGDEPPSLWFFPTQAWIITSIFEPPIEYLDPVKIMDIEFQDIKLPVRFGFDNDNDMLYISEPSGINEYKFKFVNTQSDTIKVEVEKNTILQQTASAISLGKSRTNEKILNLSVRGIDSGNVIVYNYDQKSFYDTIPAKSKVQMTLQLDYRGILILNEKANSEIEGGYQDYHIGGYMGPGKHVLLKQFEIPGNPIHLEYRQFYNADPQLVATCYESGDLKIFDGNDNSETVNINSEIGLGPRESYHTGGQIYVPAYDGYVHIVDSHSKNEISKLDAYGKAESVNESFLVLLIATPYLKDSDLPDSTITLYSRTPVSVEDDLNTKLSAYPNPAGDFIIIESKPENEELAIYDIWGNEVLKSNLNKVDIRNLKTGVYFVKSGKTILKFTKK